jgi:hypothetical protein
MTGGTEMTSCKSEVFSTLMIISKSFTHWWIFCRTDLGYAEPSINCLWSATSNDAVETSQTTVAYTNITGDNFLNGFNQSWQEHRWDESSIAQAAALANDTRVVSVEGQINCR